LGGGGRRGVLNTTSVAVAAVVGTSWLATTGAGGTGCCGLRRGLRRGAGNSGTLNGDKADAVEKIGGGRAVVCDVLVAVTDALVAVGCRRTTVGCRRNWYGPSSSSTARPTKTK